jgi:hypothetical protein
MIINLLLPQMATSSGAFGLLQSTGSATAAVEIDVSNPMQKPRITSATLPSARTLFGGLMRGLKYVRYEALWYLESIVGSRRYRREQRPFPGWHAIPIFEQLNSLFTARLQTRHPSVHSVHAKSTS